MRTITIQKNPNIPSPNVIRDLERLLLRYGYNGSHIAVDTGLHHQRCYEIPNEGVVYLNTTDRPSPQSTASQVSFLGFDESRREILGELEAAVNGLATEYLKADVDLVGQKILNAMAARQS